MKSGAFSLAILSVVAGLLAPDARAQDWATKDVCQVEDPRIDDQVFAPASRAALEEQAAGIENRRGRFWKITAPGGAVSYLWGTLHSSDPLILDLPVDVRRAIETSRLVAVEVDYTFQSRDQIRAAQYVDGRFREASDPFALLPNDSPLTDLPGDLRFWVLDRAIELGWTEDAELILSPAGMAEMLLSDPCEDFTTNVMPIQDDYVQLLGRLAGAKIVGLEEPEEFLDDLNAPEARETVEAIIAVYAAYLKPMTSNAERAANFGIYLEGRLGLMMAWDAAYLDQVLGAQGAAALKLTDAYLIALRNKRFIDRLASELPRGGVFVAVGAGHLPGRDGLITLLRDAGYDLDRVVLPGEVR